MRVLTAFVLLIVSAGTSLAEMPLPAGAQKAMKVLTETRSVGNLVFHWSGKDLDAATLEAAIERHRGYYATVKKALALTPPVPIHVFLYRDHEQLRRIHETGAWAFTEGPCVHEPHDYDDCHEFVHAFAQYLPTDEESVPPERFFVDGFATALQKEDRGVPISTWAAVAARYGRTVPLVSLRRTWPEGAPAGTHPYHLAGSFVDFVIQRHGLPKMRRLYTHCLEFQGIVGESFAMLETEWRKWLAQRPIPPDHEKLVIAAMGLPTNLVMPADLLARKSVPLLTGKSLAPWKPDVEGVWSVAKGILHGRTTGNWSILRVPAPRGEVLAIRVKFRMLRGTAFQVRMNDAPAGANEAIFAAWKTFFGLEGPGGFLGAIADSDWTFVSGKWHEAVLVNDGGVGRIYVDRILRIEVKDRAVTHAGGFALGIQAGEVEVASVEALLAD